MAMAAFDEKKLKGILKAAFREAFIENRELMQDIVEDALEDMALSRAIERIRIDRESTASHDLILWLDEPATSIRSGVFI